MRLHSLRLAAFGPFGGRQHIDFDRLAADGLFLLHGPTGAGKTSVLDAVCYALYGSVPGARQGQELRSDHAEQDTLTEVVLDFTLAGRRLEITRRPEQDRPKKRGTGLTREKAYSALRERDPATGGWRALSRSHQEIGIELRDLLVMSREEFCQVVLLPQGEFARFLRAGAEDRARLLGRLFDTRRFAAAEEHLDEQRRAALEQVRTGDERLLALAHRIQQAAGGPGGAELPAAGDPALAGAVLRLAAQARADARERLEIARLAAEAAEAAHHAARQGRDTAAALHTLQQRHRQARARQEALRERQPEREAARALLDRARAAAAVAPALDLYTEAEAEHRTARREETLARAGLPEDLAGAPAETLAGRERALRQESGTLAAARAAEDRAGRLAAEIEALDETVRRDGERLAADQEALARAEATRHRLGTALEAARQAGRDTERLEHLLAGERRRLRAAARRDALAEDADALAAAHTRAAREADTARAGWLDVRERRLAGLAAELAGRLRPGQPCAVCGSPEHPAPAPRSPGHVDREQEDAARQTLEQAEEHREELARRLAALRAEHAAAAEDAGNEPLPALTERVTALEQRLAAARAAAAGATAAEEDLARAEAGRTGLAARIEEGHRTAAGRASRRAALAAELAALQKELARARGDAPSVAERAARLEREAGLLAEAATAATRAEQTAARLKEADARLATAAYRAGFETPERAREALLPETGQRELADRLEQWSREEAEIRAVLGDLATVRAAAAPPADPEAAGAAADAALHRVRDTSAAHRAAADRCAELDRLSAEAAGAVRQLAPMRARGARIARLADLVRGRTADNLYRMRLETYVLAARLERVAAAAGDRLGAMSAGRYALTHTDVPVSRGRSGLGLRVLDAWTGRERDTATLSGGESFYVSLALALGLADVVAEEAGGQRLDSLFIDEGFGSLDEQTLDEVLDVLDGLREQERSVGIVSHVPDLRARIPARLEVVKGRRGSTLRQRAAPGAV
ncbi:AAA family ATPase [Streptomyces aidingensis]|uniref:Nuclease SbcCD subunit C n=1 Tax=Streptomyces aidingensis TaxID=910347 RepID=A0A1I1PNU6_9ACTN|nr:SMC family ATPase [Streptomyces aidingensis]SFD09318.1 exonuclease SbcC [Streptomyces aidingensis]